MASHSSGLLISTFEGYVNTRTSPNSKDVTCYISQEGTQIERAQTQTSGFQYELLPPTWDQPLYLLPKAPEQVSATQEPPSLSESLLKYEHRTRLPFPHAAQPQIWLSANTGKTKSPSDSYPRMFPCLSVLARWYMC